MARWFCNTTARRFVSCCALRNWQSRTNSRLELRTRGLRRKNFPRADFASKGARSQFLQKLLDPQHRGFNLIETRRVTAPHKTFAARAKSAAGHDGNFFLLQK